MQSPVAQRGPAGGGKVLVKIGKLAVGLSAGVVLATALGVVHIQHTTRALVAELQDVSEQRDELDIEWNRLLLEYSTWATHGRIERLAREELGMHNPSLAEVELAGTLE